MNETLQTETNENIYVINEIQSLLTPVFYANGVKKAILYGSYASGFASRESDIDLLLDSGLRGLDFVALIEIIRQTLNKEVDVIDVRYIKKGSRIDKEIQQNGVKIYG